MTPPLIDSTMYLLAGSEVCLKVIPVLAVMSSSCGTGRPVHFVAALAPGGGGGGVGWPLCAFAKLKIQNVTAIDRKKLKWKWRWRNRVVSCTYGLDFTASAARSRDAALI